MTWQSARGKSTMRHLMVIADIQYIAEGGENTIYFASTAGREADFSVNREIETRQVTVLDARLENPDRERDPLTGLAESGFMLVDQASAVKHFFADSKARAIYEHEISALLKSITACRRVHIFDHTVRSSDPETREIQQLREPSTLVHNDYTVNSGYVCLHENLGDEAAELESNRFQVINLWRPLVDPVESWPLALCDARSIDENDMVDAERRASNHIGEISLSTFNPAHKWFYYPAMNPKELLIFKTFDSENAGRGPYAIHAAINPQTTLSMSIARPRESIETRAFVFYP